MRERVFNFLRKLRGIIPQVIPKPQSAKTDAIDAAQSERIPHTQPISNSPVRRFPRRPRLIAALATSALLTLAAVTAASYIERAILEPTATLVESSRMLPFVTPTDSPIQMPTQLPASMTPSVATVASDAQAAALPTTASGCSTDTNPGTLPYQYDVEATVDVDGHTVTGLLKASYRNETGRPLTQIVFNVEPNRKPGTFSLNSLDSADGASLASYRLDGPRLEITLQRPLDVHCPARFVLGFTDRPGQIEQTYVNNFGYFGYTDRQINLGMWLPEVAPYRDGTWLTPKAWMIGGYVRTELADFTAKVSLQGKALDRWEVIGPGEVEKSDNYIWKFSLRAARSLTLSVDQGMSKLTTTSGGIEVDYYTFPPAPKGTAEVSATASTPGAPAYALQAARDAIQVYSRFYGPAPFKRLVLVEGKFPDGLEFSGIVFVSENWFALYNGQPDSWLTLITVHEIAHQWWYSLVGTDKGNNPFLDEGLAIYSESLFIENQYPKLLPWWWNFRVKSYAPQGYVDSSIYDFTNLRLYLNAVYLRGALMLQEIRSTIGDNAFLEWLRNYRAAEAGKIASVADLWQAMSPGDYTRTEPIREKYLRNPDPLRRFPSTATGSSTADTGVATALATLSTAAPTGVGTAIPRDPSMP